MKSGQCHGQFHVTARTKSTQRSDQLTAKNHVEGDRGTYADSESISLVGASIVGPRILIRGKPSQIGFNVISARRGSEGNLKNGLDLLFEVNDLLLGGGLTNEIQPARIDVFRCLVR
jgi:hypothetical protein